MNTQNPDPQDSPQDDDKDYKPENIIPWLIFILALAALFGNAILA